MKMKNCLVNWRRGTGTRVAAIQVKGNEVSVFTNEIRAKQSVPVLWENGNTNGAYWGG